MLRLDGDSHDLFPACAGMNRPRTDRAHFRPPVPRMRGDEPEFAITLPGFVDCSYPSGIGAVSGVFGLPVPRHKIVDAIDFVLRQALEDPCEPCLGVDVVQLAGFHERIGDCSRFSAAD